jgi:small subunit ribosomal protein S5
MNKKQEQNGALKEHPAKGPEGSSRETDRPDRGPKRRDGGSRGSFKRAAPENPDFMEKVLSIKRVTKVTKGGKKLSFSALVVVGDMKGRVGYSLDKAGEVAIAIRKALARAKKNMVKVPLKGTSIPHQIIGVCGGAEVLLKPASDGTGVIAAGPVRAVCEGAGIHNILTKCHRSNNPINVVKATMDGLQRMKTVQKQEQVQVQADANS